MAGGRQWLTPPASTAGKANPITWTDVATGIGRTTPDGGDRYGWLSADDPQLAAFLAQTAANAARTSEPDDINDLRARAASAAYNAEALNARWSAVPNDEIGGWAVSTDGRTPLDGGRMAADLVMTRELAEHIAEVHNQWLVRTKPKPAKIPDQRNQT